MVWERYGSFQIPKTLLKTLDKSYVKGYRYRGFDTLLVSDRFEDGR